MVFVRYNPTSGKWEMLSGLSSDVKEYVETYAAAKSHTHSEYASANHTHSNYAASSHTHDSRYYTEAEADEKFAAKSDVPSYSDASETATGLINATTQSLAGNKFIKADRFGLRMSGVTKGTAPAARQTAHIQIQDSSGANSDSASLGQVYLDVDTAGVVSLILQAYDAMTSGSKTGTTFKVVYGGGESYASVSTPSSPSLYCLRNMASGTAVAKEANCPSGAWYGKHK